MNKKQISIVAIIIVIIITIVTGLAIYFKKRAKYVYDIEKVTNIEYNTINEDNRYGVIDGNGNIIIEPNYDVIQIPNPSKPIFICMSNYNTETKEYQTKVLNDKKEQIFIGYESVQAIPTETTADGIPFEKTTLKYKKDGKYGIINIDGKEITKPIYDDITAVTYKEGMFLVKKDNKYGVINLNGINVIDVEYEKIAVDNYYDINTKYERTGFIVCKTEENGYRYGYIDFKGDMVLKTEYTEIERVTDIEDEKNIYIIAYKDGQAGLLKNGKKILEHEFEDITYNSYNDVFLVQRNGKKGIVDRKGQTKVEIKYNDITFGGVYLNVKENEVEKVIDINGNEVNDGYIAKMPTKDGQHSIVYGNDEIYKIIDNSGNIVIDKNYTYIEEVENNYFIVATYNNNGIIDLTGKSLVDLKYNSIFKLDNTELLQANISSTNSISLIDKNMQVIATVDEAEIKVENDKVIIYSENGNKYFDYSGKELTEMEAFPNNKLYAKKINNKWGFVDKDGNLKVQNEYDLVTAQNEYGFAGIKKDGKWGVINENGEIIQEPIYKLENINPMFIGKYYQSEEWYGKDYFTDKIE